MVTEFVPGKYKLEGKVALSLLNSRLRYVNDLNILEVVAESFLILWKLALFSGPHCFQLHEECGGPGIFSHVHGIKGRKVLERT